MNSIEAREYTEIALHKDCFYILTEIKVAAQGGKYHVKIESLADKYDNRHVIYLRSLGYQVKRFDDVLHIVWQ